MHIRKFRPAFILDCENRSQEGILKSFGKRGIPIYALSSKPNNPAFHSKYINKKIISPGDNEDIAYIKFLVDFPERGVLLPSTDASVALLSKNKELLKKNGYLLNVPNYDKLNMGFDKWKCYKYANNIQNPVIPTKLIKCYEDLNKAVDYLEFPLILKGTTLAGAKNIVIGGKTELKAGYEKMLQIVNSTANIYLHSEIIAQKFIHYDIDQSWSCECIYNKFSKPIGFITVQKLRPNIGKDGSYGSRLYAGINIYNEIIKDQTKKILSSLKWQGFAHVEYIYDRESNQYLLTEINPRLPGFSNFHTKTGFEMAYFYYADLMNLNFKIPEIPKSLYFEALRFPGDITGGIYSILHGHLNFFSFIKSYLKIFTFRYKISLDVMDLSDLRFTLFHWWLIIKRIIKRPFKNKK